MHPTPVILMALMALSCALQLPKDSSKTSNNKQHVNEDLLKEQAEALVFFKDIEHELMAKATPMPTTLSLPPPTSSTDVQTTPLSSPTATRTVTRRTTVGNGNGNGTSGAPGQTRTTNGNGSGTSGAPGQTRTTQPNSAVTTTSTGTGQGLVNTLIISTTSVPDSPSIPSNYPAILPSPLIAIPRRLCQRFPLLCVNAGIIAPPPQVG
jgi:hypothetical protein